MIGTQSTLLFVMYGNKKAILLYLVGHIWPMFLKGLNAAFKKLAVFITLRNKRLIDVTLKQNKRI